MNQLIEFFEKLLNVDSWPARWHCGTWTAFHGWLYICSNVAIWAAYFAIPYFLIRFLKKKQNVPLKRVFWLFTIFILLCGLTHLMDATIFWWPNYRLSALLLFFTAIVSWLTVIAVYIFFPAALALKTPSEFETELDNRKKSEARFMGLLESAPDAMVITNSKGEIIIVNEQTETCFGYKRDEIIGKDIEILIPDRFHQRHIRHRTGYVSNSKVRPMGEGMDLFGKKKVGNEFPVEISLSPLKISGEDNILIIAAIRDISNQKKAEAEIKKLNENLEGLVKKRTSELELALQNEKTAVAEINRNQQRLTFLSDASNILASSLNYIQTLTNLAHIITPKIADWCAIDEVTPNGEITRIAVSHVDPEKIKLAYELAKKYPSDANQEFQQVIQQKEPILYHEITDELLSSSAKSEEHLQIMRELGLKSALVVPLNSRGKIYGILTLVSAESERLFEEKDIEFIKELARRATLAVENSRLYKELQEVNADLEERVAKRTQELEATNKELEAFSYSVSHDLRAPLRSIDGFSNKILKDNADQLDDKGKDYFMRVKNASQHMGNLIDDLLKLSRLSRVEMNLEVTNLSNIAESIVEELKESDPERKVTFIIQPNMVSKVDKELIKIALQNLLNNAWKYSKNQTETTIEFGAFQRDRQTIYFIRDNGIGFNMRYVDKLFGAFQRLHSNSEFEGTGIGLATVQRVIRRHGGSIWAYGEINKGATFSFTI